MYKQVDLSLLKEAEQNLTAAHKYNEGRARRPGVKSLSKKLKNFNPTSKLTQRWLK